MEFNQDGNLNGGIIEVQDLLEIEQFLVKNFPASNTRSRNFDSFCDFFNDLDKTKVTRVWMDGSFCTNKVDPNDIDCVIFIRPLLENEQYFKDISAIHEQLKVKYLDVYVAFDPKHINVINQESMEAYRNLDYHEKYWQGQFGFDRERNHKAIVEIKVGI